VRGARRKAEFNVHLKGRIPARQPSFLRAFPGRRRVFHVSISETSATVS
jgi:hypothetical protein